MNCVFRGKLIYEGKELNCSILEGKKKKMMRKLATMDLAKESVVGIYFSRSVEMIVTIFALLSMDICFLPLDIGLPENRLSKIIKKAGVKKIIGNFKCFEGKDVEYYRWNHEKMGESLSVIDSTKEECAYVLFTSGTTGEPKGVQVYTQGLVNFMEAIPEVIPISCENTLISFTDYSFDIFFLETVLALNLGLNVVLATQEESNNPRLIKKLLVESPADVLQITPSRLWLLYAIDKEFVSLKKYRFILVGGEALTTDLLHLLQKNTDARIFNMYGPTETTIWSTVSELTNKKNVDIGFPIKNTFIYLIDTETKEIINDIGKVGEICISGKGVAKGYINDDMLTKEKFEVYPNLDRIYHTGDLGIYLDVAKTLKCLGRIDEQIKIRGHRIELSDIDANIKKNTSINQVASCFIEEQQKIIAFYVSNESLDEKELNAILRKHLPTYMIPSIWCVVDGLCLNKNGKLDRKALLKNWKKKRCIVDFVISNIEKSFMSENLTKTSLFKDINLSSIDFVKLILKIEEKFEFEFEDELLSPDNFTLIDDLCEYILKRVGK